MLEDLMEIAPQTALFPNLTLTPPYRGRHRGKPYIARRLAFLLAATGLMIVFLIMVGAAAAYAGTPKPSGSSSPARPVGGSHKSAPASPRTPYPVHTSPKPCPTSAAPSSASSTWTSTSVSTTTAPPAEEVTTTSTKAVPAPVGVASITPGVVTSAPVLPNTGLPPWLPIAAVSGGLALLAGIGLQVAGSAGRRRLVVAS